MPRHVFVPAFVACWPPEEEGSDGRLVVDSMSDSERWMRLVYSDRLLIIVDDGARRSSSSSPSVMARFLDLLDVRDGATVLEVGTGSGYNAAVLCDRLGSAQVTSIDVDSELVETARPRLAGCGCTPTLAVADGWDGYPARALYDRIIATCSMPRIPVPWIDQLRAGGVVVAPLQGGRFDAGLVALRRMDDGSLSGRLDRDGAAFMPMRGGSAGTAASSRTRAALRALVDGTDGETRACTVPPYFLDASEPSMPPHLLLRLDETSTWEWCWFDGLEGEPRAPTVAAADGSWARVVLCARPIRPPGRSATPLGHGGAQLAAVPGAGQAGDGPLRPHRRPRRTQEIWLDSPDSAHRRKL